MLCCCRQIWLLPLLLQRLLLLLATLHLVRVRGVPAQTAAIRKEALRNHVRRLINRQPSVHHRQQQQQQQKAKAKEKEKEKQQQQQNVRT